MGSKEFTELCIKSVVDYFNNRSDKTDNFSQAQTITPSTGFEAMAQVNVGAISVTKTLNSASGYTVMVG